MHKTAVSELFPNVLPISQMVLRVQTHKRIPLVIWPLKPTLIRA